MEQQFEQLSQSIQLERQHRDGASSNLAITWVDSEKGPKPPEEFDEGGAKEIAEEQTHEESWEKFWVTVAQDLPFDLPKGLEEGDQLLCTRQANRLAQDVRSRKDLCGVAKNCFILSGPSGIGKSGITLWAVLYLKYHMKECVLYVHDAGEIVRQARGEQAGLSENLTFVILRLLVAMWNKQNPERPCDDCQTMRKFAEFLNEARAVVLIDEQGSAYDMLGEDQLFCFPMILPNFWISGGRYVRLVLTGSRQASFEIALNGEYTTCLRLVSPFQPDEAAIFANFFQWKFDLHDISFYCNCVPREIKRLYTECEGNTSVYVKERTQDIYRVLSKKLLADRQKNSNLADLLLYLFRDRTLHSRRALVPFVDLGYVFCRRQPTGETEAFPLCIPAETALLNLWKHVDAESTGISLEKCISLSRGDDFEIFVFFTLVKNYVDAERTLPCRYLGYSLDEHIPVKIDAVHTATCSPTRVDVVDDINRVREVAIRRRETILYHCPKNAPTIDFCIISASRVLAIQVSLQSLTEHDSPDCAVLDGIHASNAPGVGTRNTRPEWRFLYITAKPTRHPRIARKEKWNGIAVQNIRIIDAHHWLHKIV